MGWMGDQPPEGNLMNTVWVGTLYGTKDVRRVLGAGDWTTATTSPPEMSTRRAWQATYVCNGAGDATQIRSVLWQCSWWIEGNVNPQPALHPLDAAVGKCIKFSSHKSRECTTLATRSPLSPPTPSGTGHPGHHGEDVQGKAQLSSLAGAQKSCHFLSYNFIIINLNGFRSNGRISCEMGSSRGTPNLNPFRTTHMSATEDTGEGGRSFVVVSAPGTAGIMW